MRVGLQQGRLWQRLRGTCSSICRVLCRLAVVSCVTAAASSSRWTSFLAFAGSRLPSRACRSAAAVVGARFSAYGAICSVSLHEGQRCIQ